MVDFINGRHSGRSILDVFTSGLFGNASELPVGKRTGDQTSPSIIVFETSVTHFTLQEYIVVGFF